MHAWQTRRAVVLGAALAAFGAGAARAEEVLAPPVRVAAADVPIDVGMGHAAPWVCDWDGDGTWDLLVGQFGAGRLRIYRNAGTAAEPRFESSQAFRAGESEGAVPSG